jgi:hypothetical protein
LSHPTPLHPNADLAVVLDDMRQNVAAWGDEGMVMRVFRASICLMLLSILDTLIDLLADFRAGRLPPVLPAWDEPEYRQPALRRQSKDGAPAVSTQGPAAPGIRAVSDHVAAEPQDEPAAAPVQSAAEPSAAAPRHPRLTLVSSHRPVSRPEPVPRLESYDVWPRHVRQRAAYSARSVPVPNTKFRAFEPPKFFERFDSGFLCTPNSFRMRNNRASAYLPPHQTSRNSIRARNARSRSFVCAAKTSRGGPSTAIRPASMNITRDATSRAKVISCVTRIIVMPSRAS